MYCSTLCLQDPSLSRRASSSVGCVWQKRALFRCALHRGRLDRICPAQSGKRLLRLMWKAPFSCPAHFKRLCSIALFLFSLQRTPTSKPLYCREHPVSWSIRQRHLLQPFENRILPRGVFVTTPLNFRKRRQPQHRQNGQVSATTPCCDARVPHSRSTLGLTRHDANSSAASPPRRYVARTLPRHDATIFEFELKLELGSSATGC